METEHQDPGYDRLLKLIGLLEKRLATEQPTGRPTDTYYRPTRQLVDEQKRICTEECEKRVASSEKTQCLKIQTLKEDLAGLKKQVTAEVEKGKDEASKTQENLSMSFKDRIRRMEKTLYSGDTGDLSARVLTIEASVGSIEADKEDETKNSRFSKTYILAVVAFLVSTAIASTGLILSIIMMSKNAS